MDKGIEVNDFSKMFLYTLCMNSKIVRSDKESNKFVYDISLPYRFKDAIICILSANPGWMKKYSKLIYIEEYFRFGWDYDFAYSFKNLINKYAESMEYDLLFDNINIKVPTKYSKELYNAKYSNELYEIMKDLIELINSYIYSRRCMFGAGPYCYARGVEDFRNIQKSDVDPLEYVTQKDLGENVKKKKL